MKLQTVQNGLIVIVNDVELILRKLAPKFKTGQILVQAKF